MRARKRYYQVLGVSRDAPPAEVKRAYRALAKRLHPDRLGDPEAAHRAEERLKEINAAWNEYCALARAGAEREAGPEPKRGHTRRGAPPPDDEEAYWAARKAERERASGWQRRPGRATRDRYRAERARTFRDREERERRDRERVAEVRRERARQVHERVTRDHERLRGIVLLLAGAALMLAAAFVVLLVVVFVSG